jgi:NADPH:quinone reductase
MSKAIRIHQHGGPEEMSWEEAALAPLANGEVTVRHTAIGINFSDINVRRGGFYPNQFLQFPLGLGNEAAGVVECVGPGVTDFKIGDRVAYAGMLGQFYEQTGAYSEYRNVPAERLAPIPAGVSDQQAAAILLKGSTASLIINRLYTPRPGDSVLVHTAAAGVGSILCQWSKHLGATVLGTVGSREKAQIGRRNGCDHVILYRETDFVSEVQKLIPGGLSAVFDGVGLDTFLPSLKCLRTFGHAVNYGNASGSVPPLDIQTLAVKSLSVSRAGVTGHIQDAVSLRKVAAELFDLVARDILFVDVQKTYALRDAAAAHADVESARYTGSMLLIP